MAFLFNCFNCVSIKKFYIQCPVCYEELYISDRKILILDCGHLICEDCLLNLNICPLCRSNIQNFYYVENFFKCFNCKKQLLTFFLKCGHCFCYNCVSKFINFQDYYFCNTCKIFSRLIKIYY